MDPICKHSVVIPVFNEAEALVPLHGQLVETLSRLDGDFELVFVNDGSTDGTAAILDELFAADARLQVLHLRRNFGKAAALSAGFSVCRGEIIITMDGDLQDLPEEIPRFLEKLEDEYDLVSGWKYPRRDPLRRRLASRCYNLVTRWTTGVQLHDINCGFKAYRREVITNLKLYGELHRYIPVLAFSQGFRVGEIKVTHRNRPFGKSKYGLWRFLSGFFDLVTILMLTRFSARPLHVFGMIGFLATLLGSGITLYLLVLRMFGTYLSNRPLFYFGLTILSVGIQMVFFGLLAEMIAHSRSAETFYSVRRHLSRSPGEGQERD